MTTRRPKTLPFDEAVRGRITTAVIEYKRAKDVYQKAGDGLKREILRARRAGYSERAVAEMTDGVVSNITVRNWTGIVGLTPDPAKTLRRLRHGDE